MVIDAVVVAKPALGKATRIDTKALKLVTDIVGDNLEDDRCSKTVVVQCLINSRVKRGGYYSMPFVL
jgi:hypothetical protein